MLRFLEKTKNGKKFEFLTKIVDLPVWKNSIFFTVLKEYFYSLESLSFHLEYQ